MSPLRIFIIALLLFIGFRLLFGRSKKNIQGDKKDSGQPLETPVEDVLVEDPVCFVLVPKQQAIPLQDGESTVYFCSQKCCDTFIAQKGD